MGSGNHAGTCRTMGNNRPVNWWAPDDMGHHRSSQVVDGGSIGKPWTACHGTVQTAHDINICAFHHSAWENWLRHSNVVKGGALDWLGPATQFVHQFLKFQSKIVG